MPHSEVPVLIIKYVRGMFIIDSKMFTPYLDLACNVDYRAELSSQFMGIIIKIHAIISLFWMPKFMSLLQIATEVSPFDAS